MSRIIDNIALEAAQNPSQNHYYVYAKYIRLGCRVGNFAPYPSLGISCLCIGISCLCIGIPYLFPYTEQFKDIFLLTVFLGLLTASIRLKIF
ncbi:MAG: hypothetical protein PUI54_04580 [Bacteroidales bacterium]|nr:hypothetical protein [Bacteroidales bacterium]